MAKGNVELWLGDLLNQSMNSLHAVIRDAYHAINDGGFNLMNFLGQFASQVPSLVFWYISGFVILSLKHYRFHFTLVQFACNTFAYTKVRDVL